MQTKQLQKLSYALSENEQGFVEYCGQVVHETQDQIRIEMYDATMLWMAGSLELTGELKDIQKTNSRIFNDKDSFKETLRQSMTRQMKQ